MTGCATSPDDPGAGVGAERHSGEGITGALLGATGMVGSFVLEQALEDGYGVRALARTPAKLAAYADRIEIIAGDARDPDVLRRLVKGSDVVISALGPVRGDGAAALALSTDVARLMTGILPEAGHRRYVVVSGGAVQVPGDQRDLLGWTIRKLAQLAYGSTVRDKQQEFEILAASSLQWTLVRCPLIDPEPFQRPAVASLATPPAFRLRAGELARFLLEQAHSADYRQRAPFLGSY